MHCILWWGSSHRDLHKVWKHLPPYLGVPLQQHLLDKIGPLVWLVCPCVFYCLAWRLLECIYGWIHAFPFLASSSSASHRCAWCLKISLGPEGPSDHPPQNGEGVTPICFLLHLPVVPLNWCGGSFCMGVPSQLCWLVQELKLFGLLSCVNLRGCLHPMQYMVFACISHSQVIC